MNLVKIAGRNMASPVVPDDLQNAGAKGAGGNAGAGAAPRNAASSAFRLRHVRAGLLSPRGLVGSHCLAVGALEKGG